MVSKSDYFLRPLPCGRTGLLLLRLTAGLLLSAIVLVMPPAFAQTKSLVEVPASKSVEPEQEAQYKDSLRRDTPRGSFEGFILAVDERDFVKAGEYIDVRNLPAKYRGIKPARLAQMLGIIIERELWIDPEELSDDPKGEAGDGLPAYRDELGRIGKADNEYVLLMQRVPAGDGEFVWKVSNATVARIADMYSEFGYGRVAEMLAKNLPDVRFLGVDLFKWVLSLGSGLAVYPFVVIIGLILTRIFSSPGSPLFRRVRYFLAVPFALFMTILIMRLAIGKLGLGISGQKLIGAGTLLTLMSIWLLLSGINLLRHVYAQRLHEQGKENAVVLLRPVSRAIQILIIIIGGLVWLENAGFNITAILTGLGVGGVAVALALQKPLEDIFGAVSLFTLQPVRVGDFCRIGEFMGTIEEIGLRTTRIRTLDNTLISLPNAKLAGEAVDNFTVRKKFLYRPTLRLRLNTSRKQVQKVLEGVRQMLESHGRVIQKGSRIRFEKIAPDALELKIFAYTDAQDYAESLELAEDLNSRILEIIESEGTELVPPGWIIYRDEFTGDGTSNP